jgi:hypothetical protein
MVKCPQLVEKISTLLEVNVNFNVYADNVFQTTIKNNSTAIDEEARQVVSLCSVMHEKPYVQY